MLNYSNDYVFEKGKWTKSKLKTRSSKRDSVILFHSKGFNNSNFKVVQTEKNTYFVLNGGGPVLQLKNDSIVRIDNSVEQKNQFGAATFVYKNKMYMYGGYGFGLLKTIPHIMTSLQINGSFLELSQKYSHVQDGSLFMI